MGAITLLAVLTGRRKQALPALCAAIIALLALWPALAVNAGFALSVVATGGLILLAPSWADWLRARGWWRVPAEIVAVSAGAFVVTTPILIALTGRLSLVAVLANVLVAPVVAPITVIGAGGAVLASSWSPLAELILRCAAPPLWWLLWVAGYAAALPGATVTVPGGLAGGLIASVVVAVAIAALRARAVRRVAAALVLGGERCRPRRRPGRAGRSRRRRRHRCRAGPASDPDLSGPVAHFTHPAADPHPSARGPHRRAHRRAAPSRGRRDSGRHPRTRGASTAWSTRTCWACSRGRSPLRSRPDRHTGCEQYRCRKGPCEG
jgi:hypothetical protein